MGSFISDFAHQQLDGMQELRRDFGRRDAGRPPRSPRSPQARGLRDWIVSRRASLARLARVPGLPHGAGSSRRVADH